MVRFLRKCLAAERDAWTYTLMKPTEQEKISFLKSHLPAAEIGRWKEYEKEVNRVWTRFRGNHKSDTKRFVLEIKAKQPDLYALGHTNVAEHIIATKKSARVDVLHHREEEIIKNEVADIILQEKK